MKCPECSLSIPAIEIVNHYSEHLFELKKEIQYVSDFCREKKKMYRDKINVFCKLYQNIFPNEDIEEHDFPHENSLS